MALQFLLVLPLLCSFSSGQLVGDDVQCPRLPCPLPPCADPHPTYYMYHGKRCQGCSQCDVIQKRQLHPGCPDLQCAVDPSSCPVPLSITTYPFMGSNCRGCPVCPSAGIPSGASAQKRQLHPGCPDLQCAVDPSSCPVPLSITTYPFMGSNCRGCPVCPSAGMPSGASAQKRQMHPGCPDLQCAVDPSSCPVPLSITTYPFMGSNCRGCPVCPSAGMPSGASAQKRQLHPGCPDLQCAVDPSSCPVPLSITTYPFMGSNCRGCPVCPSAGMPSGASAQKRQLDKLDPCPIIDCMLAGHCSVPLQRSTWHINGKDCLGCAFCPTA